MPGCKIVHTRVDNSAQSAQQLHFVLSDVRCTLHIHYFPSLHLWILAKPTHLAIHIWIRMVIANQRFDWIYLWHRRGSVWREVLPMQPLSLSKDNIKECFYQNIERYHPVVFIHSFIKSVSLPSNQLRISIFLDSLELASNLGFISQKFFFPAWHPVLAKDGSSFQNALDVRLDMTLRDRIS